jgi:lipid II:glycine glycyltransferase (peptidoglycan interpeptide bridge formation enzyme)
MQSEKHAQDWNEIIASLPDAHLLQSREWAQVKSPVGWEPATRVWGDPDKPDAAALILYRTVSIAWLGPKLRIMYIPKGPLLRDWGDQELRRGVLDDLTALARQKGAIFLKIDPDVPLGRGIPARTEGNDDPMGAAVLGDLTARGFHYSDEQVQFRNTVLIDLSPPDDALLASMKQKTRYNIRLAGRKGVAVRKGTPADLGMLYRMYAETSMRDGFTIRGENYYLDLWKTFMAQDEPTCQPLIAEVDGEPVAGVMVFCFARRAYYLHGMSRTVHREKMPNYLLQWEAMKYARSAGCITYDLWGAPEVFDESDSMWGVFRFKRGLGGEVLRTIGAYDLPIRPTYYKLYTQVLPRALALMRRRGKTQTREIADR